MFDYFIFYRESLNKWVLRDANFVELGFYTRKDSAVRRIKTLSSGVDCCFVVIKSSAEESRQIYSLVNKTVVLLKNNKDISDSNQALTDSSSNIDKTESEKEFDFRIYSDFSVQDCKEQQISDSYEILTVEAPDFESAKWAAEVHAFKLERTAKLKSKKSKKSLNELAANTASKCFVPPRALTQRVSAGAERVAVRSPP